MVVCLRLSRLRCRNKPFYKVMDADSRSPRDGKHLEILGYTIPSWLSISDELQRRNLELDSFRAKIEENQEKNQAEQAASLLGQKYC
ncbi:hypothetical protein OROHE_012528 [Orobanche hederae]